MSSNPPPLGYISLNEPTTLRETFEQFRVTDRSVSIAKSALQNYFNSFLDPKGVNRPYLTSSLSPAGLQFVTNLSYDDQMKADPNLRKTYLARFFAENTGRLPAILIIDSGVTYQDEGMNDLVGASSIGGRWQGTLFFFLRINFSISVATLSEEDTSTLASVIVMMLGPLANIVNNYVIHEHGQPWELRLPLAAVSIGQGSALQVEGDSKTTIWTRTVDFTCDFETVLTISQNLDGIIPPDQVVIGSTDLNPAPKITNLSPNQGIPLGLPYPVYISNMRLNHRLACSDPNVALVSAEPPYFIYPRAQGRALLLVLDTTQAEGGTTVATPANKQLVLDFPFRITR